MLQIPSTDNINLILACQFHPIPHTDALHHTHPISISQGVFRLLPEYDSQLACSPVPPTLSEEIQWDCGKHPGEE